MFIERLAGGSLGSPNDDFVVVEWTAEIGTHWIAPLHIHHADDEAWYVLEGTLVAGDEARVPGRFGVDVRRARLPSTHELIPFS